MKLCEVNGCEAEATWAVPGENKELRLCREHAKGAAWERDRLIVIATKRILTGEALQDRINKQ